MRIWKMRAGKSGKHWKAWDGKNIVAIGWDVGDLAELDWEETRERVARDYPNSEPGSVTGKIRTFAGVREDGENMGKGDIVVVLGSGTVLGVAEVGEYEYVEEGIEDSGDYPYKRDAEYSFKGPVRIRDLSEKFRQGGEYSLHLPSTLMRCDIPDELLEELLNELESKEKADVEKNPFIDFSEESLQEYIEDNYPEIREDILELKREYSTAVGDADFLCELKSGGYLVIETKIGTAGDSAVGQILGYMNAIRKAKPGMDVEGVIIAEDFTPRVRSAVLSDSIDLWKFRAKLEFQKS